MTHRQSFMKSLLLSFLVFVCFLGYSQNLNQESLEGSWTLISSHIVHPSICWPGRDPKAGAGQKFTFYKLGDLLYHSQERKENDVHKGTWKINHGNNLTITLNDTELKYKVRFVDSRLFLRNGIVELEFKK